MSTTFCRLRWAELTFVATAAVVLTLGTMIAGAQTSPKSPSELPTKPSTVERTGPNTLRMGQVRVDTARREVSVPGTVNDAKILEFVANTKGGFKAYESALSLETDAVTFNAALLLIGLDRSKAVGATRHFDPRTPQGDPVDVFVEWTEGSTKRRERAEKLVYHVEKKATLPEGPWVYTGSTFIEGGGFLADMDGVLISFVHTPSPLIENPSSFGVAAYGTMQINPDLGLKPGMPVTVTVKAIAKK